MASILRGLIGYVHILWRIQCTSCGGMAVANELHMICDCPALQPVRQQFALLFLADTNTTRSFFAQEVKFVLKLSWFHQIWLQGLSSSTCDQTCRLAKALSSLSVSGHNRSVTPKNWCHVFKVKRFWVKARFCAISSLEFKVQSKHWCKVKPRTCMQFALFCRKHNVALMLVELPRLSQLQKFRLQCIITKAQEHVLWSAHNVMDIQVYLMRATGWTMQPCFTAVRPLQRGCGVQAELSACNV